MKKFLSLLICFSLMLSLSAFAFANSGPTFWEGYPTSEILSIEQNTPITVDKENLIFDFSANDNPESKDLYDASYSIAGQVTASYQMHNPTNQIQIAQMAFPFINSLNSISTRDILITVDDKPISYEIFAGDEIVRSGGFNDEANKANFDFDKIVKSISNEPYKAKNFAEDEKGKLYIIKVSPTSDQEINYAIDFQFNPEKTKIITHSFNRFQRNDNNSIRIASWCEKPEELELFVLGEDIDFNEEAFSDGNLSLKTDLYSAVTATHELELKEYIMGRVPENLKKSTDGNTSPENLPESKSSLSETQIYNTYAKYLDRYLASNAGHISHWEGYPS